MIIHDWPKEWRVRVIEDKITVKVDLWQDDPWEKQNGNQGWDPLANDIPQMSLTDGKNESSATLTDP